MEKWSSGKAWEWYNSRPWIRGFNYIASNCVNRLDQWQEYGHEEKFKTIAAEFALAKETGFNSVRAVLPFDVWLGQHDTFMRYLEEYLCLAAANGMSVMLVLISDGGIPSSEPVFGPVGWDPGYHGGIKKAAAERALPEPKASPVDDAGLAEKFYEYVDELSAKYAKDERVLFWNIWNEPGNSSRKTKSVVHMKRAFEIVRSHSPFQPCAADVWRFPKDKPLSEEEQIALELSDCISYHDYGSAAHSVRVLEYLRTFDRPLFLTEWLQRIQFNNVSSHLPLYFSNNIAIYNWGLVAGKAQNYEPWESVWKRYYGGEKLDITKWQHDLFRPNHRPYDPEEIRLFKFYFGLADKKNQLE